MKQFPVWLQSKAVPHLYLKLITSGKESEYKMVFLLGKMDLDTLATPGYYPEALSNETMEREKGIVSITRQMERCKVCMGNWGP